MAWAVAAVLAGQPAVVPISLVVNGDKDWTDTGIDLELGDVICLEADGMITLQSKEIGREGGGRGWADLLKAYPLNDAPKGALIARLGDSDAARPFLVGTRVERPAHIRGRLFLGINQAQDRATGSFRVKLTRV